jgi:hypothetical protein
MSLIAIALGLLMSIFGFGAGSDAATTPAGSVVRSNVKQVVNTIESCAASRIDGAYAGGTDENCLAPATLVGYEKSLESVGLQSTPPTAADQVQVMPLGTDHMGYAVQSAEDADGTLVYFVEAHLSDGELIKLCGTGAPFAPAELQSDSTNSIAARPENDSNVHSSCNLSTGTW